MPRSADHLDWGEPAQRLMFDAFGNEVARVTFDEEGVMDRVVVRTFDTEGEEEVVEREGKRVLVRMVFDPETGAATPTEQPAGF